MSKIMKFPKDMYYADKDVPLYEAGKEYSVPDNMVDRWIKRGGEVVVVSEKKAVATVKTLPAPVIVPEEQESFDLEDSDEFDVEETVGTEKKVAKKKVSKKSRR